MEGLGGLLEASWGVLEASEGVLEASWGILEPSWRRLEASRGVWKASSRPPGGGGPTNGVDNAPAGFGGAPY